MNLYEFVENWLSEHIVMAGAMLAFITSLLRTWRQETSISSKLLDSLLCMSLTLGIYYTATSFYQLPDVIAVGIGSFVGYFGTEQVKQVILNRFSNITKSNNKD